VVRAVIYAIYAKPPPILARLSRCTTLAPLTLSPSLSADEWCSLGIHLLYLSITRYTREQILSNPLQLSVTTARIDTLPSASVSSPYAMNIEQMRGAGASCYQEEPSRARRRKKHAVSDGVGEEEGEEEERKARPPRRLVEPTRVSSPQVDLTRCGLNKTPTPLALHSTAQRGRKWREKVYEGEESRV
jgi:hypothetical protein